MKNLTNVKIYLYTWALRGHLIWAFKNTWAFTWAFSKKPLYYKGFKMPNMWAFSNKINTKQRNISLYIGHLEMGIKNFRPIMGLIMDYKNN